MSKDVKPKQRLEKAMVAAAWQGRAEADLTMLVVDASKKKPDADTLAIIKRLAQENENARFRPII